MTRFIVSDIIASLAGTPRGGRLSRRASKTRPPGDRTSAPPTRQIGPLRGISARKLGGCNHSQKKHKPLSSQGFVSIFEKVVRLVDWPRRLGRDFSPRRHPKIRRKLLILHGMFVTMIIDQVLQQYLPKAAEGDDLLSEARRTIFSEARGTIVALLFLRRSPRTFAQGSSQGAHSAIGICRLLINS